MGELPSFAMEGTTLKLLYFDVAAKAECIRLAMAYGGIEFVDHRFSGVDEFNELKQNGMLRFGQVPALEVTAADGTSNVLTQSLAILRFVAKLAPPELDMYPADPVVACLVDGICDQEADAFMGFRITKYKARLGFGILEQPEGAAVLAAAESANVTEVIPRHLGTLNAQLVSGGTGWLAGTAQPSIADFFWAPWLSWMESYQWCGDGVDVLANTPELASWLKRFYDLPSVVSYYQSKGAQE